MNGRDDTAADGTTRRRICLHIGTHRTGTTSLQGVLVQNAEALAAAGFTVIFDPRRKKRPTANLATLANSVLRARLRSRPRAAGRLPHPWPWVRRRGLRHFRSAIDAAPGPNVILSTEDLCMCRTAAEARRLRRLFAGYELRIAVAFRDEAGWRRSRAAQFDGTSPIDALRGRVAEADMVDGDWYFDPDAIRRFWAPLGTLCEVDYDAAVAADGTSVPRVLAALGLPELGLDGQVFLNRSADKRRGAGRGA